MWWKRNDWTTVVVTHTDIEYDDGYESSCVYVIKYSYSRNKFKLETHGDDCKYNSYYLKKVLPTMLSLENLTMNYNKDQVMEIIKSFLDSFKVYRYEDNDKSLSKEEQINKALEDRDFDRLDRIINEDDSN